MNQAAIAMSTILLLVYAGFPLLLLAVAALRRAHASAIGSEFATLSILICAHNEAAHIGAKLESVVAAASTWGERAEILVADDGSTDTTAAIVDGYADRGVRLLRLARGGKAAALNRLAASARGEILVMSDADPLFDAGTLPALLAPFGDPSVGAVAGCVETIGRRGRFAVADRLYRLYESAIRRAEAKLFGCVSADGGLFAIRTALMPHVPADVTDDFYISTAAVAAGRRIAFADRARVHEHSVPGARQQFRRRLRITVRGLTALWYRRALMNPLRTGWYAPALVMHKLARRLAPLLLLPLWAAMGLAAFGGHMLWWPPFVAVSALFAAGALCIVSAWSPRALGPVQAAILHFAALAGGVLLFACGRRYTQWSPQKGGARAT